ncbi:hypothetical protein TanjilG_28135 [Lupinus angustifolius]|uniref:Polygalacturonase n=1 Tax=Lupinus angustifolius TaxID=3871 RepID=A0A1J7GX94_LUPAN|nr:hypothetical protein TanjilG_28135 [Lupinus angustifolius]
MVQVCKWCHLQRALCQQYYFHNIDGELVAPSYHKGNGKAEDWLLFESVNNVFITKVCLMAKALLCGIASILAKEIAQSELRIGSLGWNKKEPDVQHVTIRSVIFIGTQNGVRIKSWGRPSSGFVKEVIFQNATMVDVQNPILIDQNYCPSKKNCPSQVSGIKISDITYEDIHGTSATQVAMKFDCSSTNPCKGIRLEDIKLTYRNQVAQASCKHVGISDMKSVQPERCS